MKNLLDNQPNGNRPDNKGPNNKDNKNGKGSNKNQQLILAF